MVTQHYSAQQRRGLNQVWAAAGEYGFEPLFLSMDSAGKPDLYMNSIVGYVRKWYGEEAPKALFDAWAGDRRQPLLDDLAWLALENAVYQKEAPRRPVLAELRRDHAAAFFDQEYQLSRQEWMAKNQLDYAMNAARWRMVLGQRSPFLLPHEKKLAQALLCGGELDGEELNKAVLAAFDRAGLFHGKRRTAAALHFHLTGRAAQIMSRLMPGEIVHTDVASVGLSGGGAGEGTPSTLDPRRAKMRLNEDAGADRAYIESCFGRSLYPPHALAVVERNLCTGVHQGCHLWFTAGTPDPDSAATAEARTLARQAQLQYQRNREAYAGDAGLYQNAILRLTEQIQNCLQVHAQAETERSRGGRLEPERAWRAAVLKDPRIFLRDADANDPGFSVDLLLDGSASRQYCQEVIAAQGYILSESLARCGVPVRVSGFCSLRGYTVLRVLKDFGDKDGSRKVFRYFATGWNRDGLALRAAGELLKRAPKEKRLLILLTDASPNDSHRIPPGGKYPLGRDYSDAPAVEDAAREVRDLRRQGVRVAAVYMGSTFHAADAQRIYGESLARIRGMDQLSDAAGKLIQREVRELG